MRNKLQGKPSHCVDCKTTADVHVVTREPGNPKSGHLWLCGSCEILRANPDAVIGKMPELPIKRAGRVQKERLFDV